MIKIIFVCHGNICRSPAAEFVFKKLVKERKIQDKYESSSLALTTEEIGNDIYPPMKRALDKAGIKYQSRQARLIDVFDYEDADYIVYMDRENEWLINQSYPRCDKAICLAKFINQDEITDPWYHHDFDGCLQQIYKAINKFIDWLETK